MRWLQRAYARHCRKRGDRLLDRDRATKAWKVYQRAPYGGMCADDWWMRGVCCLIGLGRMDLALQQFATVHQLKGPPMGRWRVLRSVWVGSIGHIGQLDYVVKMNILEGGKPEDLILYLPRPCPTPNMFFIAQYLPYVKLVYDDKDLPFDADDAPSMEWDILAPRTRDGNTHYFWGIAASVYRRWESEGRGPLVAFPPPMVEPGWQRLVQMGVPRDAWFVTLHVRESNKFQSHRQLHELRNAEMWDYWPAIEEVTKRGGWVIRIGDKTMSKMKPMKNVLDYPHQALVEDWMDIFLLSQCRFHIGSTSGVSYVPGCYGVRSVICNNWPPAGRPWHAGDIFVPKVYRNGDDGREFELQEMLQQPFAWPLSLTALREMHDVTVDNNDPEDIRLAVVEMFGECEYTERDMQMRRTADTLMETHGAYGQANIARDFLRRHEGFVP